MVVEVAVGNPSFNYGDDQVRTIVIDGEPWFVASDVCAVLGIANSRDAVTRLDEASVGSIDVPNANGALRRTKIVNEEGLYDLVLDSRKPEAKAFRRWITSEVLPSIRKAELPRLCEPLQVASQLFDLLRIGRLPQSHIE